MDRIAEGVELNLDLGPLLSFILTSIKPYSESTMGFDKMDEEEGDYRLAYYLFTSVSSCRDNPSLVLSLVHRIAGLFTCH